MQKIGFVGAGKWAKVLAVPLQRDGYKVESIYAPDDSASHLAREVESKAAESFAAILNDSEITHVVIASPSATHLDYLTQLNGNNKQVLCAAPAISSPSELRALEKILNAAESKIQLSLPLCFKPEFARGQTAAVKELGNLGTIRLALAVSPERRSGNTVVELGASLLGYLAGIGEIRSIYGMMNEVDNRQYCLATGRLSDGTIVHLELSMAESGRGYEAYEFTGTNGLIEYDSRTEPVYQMNANGANEIIGLGDAAGYLEARTWLQRDAADTQINEQALRGLKTAFALLESLDNNRPVDVVLAV